jgi:hypothetical protein
MNADETYLFIERSKRKKKMLELEEPLDDLNTRRRAAQKYKGMDTDKDNFDDGAEIYPLGVHTTDNKHIERLGPTTPGKAFVSGSTGMIRFPYDNSMVSLEVKGTRKTIGEVHKMKEPRKMRLQVDFGNMHNHTNSKGGFKVNIPDVYPDKYRMGDGKIGGTLPNMNINGVLGKIDGCSKQHSKKMDDFSKKFSSRIGGKESKSDTSDINDLSKRLSNFVHGQKSKPKKVSFGNLDIGASNLNFEAVGIKKKKTGGII